MILINNVSNNGFFCLAIWAKTGASFGPGALLSKDQENQDDGPENPDHVLRVLNHGLRRIMLMYTENSMILTKWADTP